MIRTLLFLPGNTPNMLVNGDILEADALILDLEDAVSPDEKDAARILVRNYLRYQKKRNKKIVIRINACGTPYWKEDLDELIGGKPDFVMPTKVDGPEMVLQVSEYISELERKEGIEEGTVRLFPLIETALGVEKAYEIASATSRVAGILLGAEDLTADLQCRRTKQGDEIFYARSRMVCAARAAGVAVFDTPFTDVDDLAGLCTDAEKARGLGFSGKMVISPRHLAEVNRIFSPTAKEVLYAQKVLETIEWAKQQGKGVVSLDGKMIDAPIVMRAKQTVLAAEQCGGELYE